MHDDVSSIIGISIVIHVASSKASIYPESLDFFNQEKLNPMEFVIDSLGRSAMAFTNRAELIRHKNDGLLYRKWDTYWNEKGGYLGFLGLMEKLNEFIEVKYESLKDADFTYLIKPASGDVGGFLKLNLFHEHIYSLLVPSAEDPTLSDRGAYETPIAISSIDPTTFEFIAVDEEHPNHAVDGIKVDGRPAAVVLSQESLNEVDVLWLKDSFGLSMSFL
jgi:hypothetical protein